VQEKIGKPLSQGFFNTVQPAVYNKISEVMNPGSSYVSPALKRFGFNPKLAGAIGLGIDFAAPGPGEYGQFEKSVVQRVNDKTGAQEFFKIPKGKLRDFHNVIDEGVIGNAGLTAADGFRWHLTAKNPAQMLGLGFKDMGLANIKDIPIKVSKHTRGKTNVREYTRKRLFKTKE